ncbi:zinc finger protein 391-like [Topomyia yanbarensis]|uniref:zinc finger protein 391-like n=1 Tax=Topomyia yanbarensis TaxID=2498891 RepID=UPI00273CAB0B|nr:zinc finger protein 391-like [Topomyia yanbarensis]
MDFYASICRLCEATDKLSDKWLNLFAAGNEHLLVKISSICCLEIRQQDKLPKRICGRCTTSLEQAYNFKLQCEITQAKLQHEIEFLEQNNWNTGLTMPPFDFARFQEIKQEVALKQTFETDVDLPVEPVLIKDEVEEMHEVNVSPVLPPEPDETLSELCSSKVEIIPKDEDEESKNGGSSVPDSEESDATDGSDSEALINKKQRIQRINEENTEQSCSNICDVCGEQFEKSSELRAHVRNVHGKKRFRCETCSRCFSRKTRLQDHELRHTGLRQFQCEHCDKAYVTRYGLKTHMEDAHSENLPYVCDKCGRGFSKAAKLRLHYSMHIESRNFVCNVCSKGYKTQSHLNMHMNTHLPQGQKKVRKRRNREKVCVCPFCGKVSTSLGTHTMHIRTHTGDQRYECHICFKRFTSSGSHKKHLRVHSGEKPFVCEFCHKSFRQKHHMTTHIRGVHTNEKPYQCKYCPKSFATRGNMTLHERSHVGAEAAVVLDTATSDLMAQRQMLNDLRSEINLNGSPSHSSSMMTTSPSPMLNPGVLIAPSDVLHQPDVYFQDQ